MYSVYAYTTIYYCLLFIVYCLISYVSYYIIFMLFYCQCNRFIIKYLTIFSFAIAPIDNKPLILYHKYINISENK